MLGSVALIAALLVVAPAQVPYGAPKALAERLKSLAGAGALDCGTVILGDDSANAVECAEGAQAAGKPYRLAIEFEGPDGAAAWQGAARDAAGKHWAVYFDSDPAAKPGTGDSLSVVPCSEIDYAQKGDDVVRCRPMLGKR